MAGNIYHKWDGSVLTITSDSGTSSSDLKGAKGDDGPRGAQGAPGSSVAEDSQKLGGVAAAQYALKNGVPAHNLLDNSDFRNPVNQRGKTSYSASGYTIDRWRTWDDGTVTINNGYISHETPIYQTIGVKLDTSKAYTLAVMNTNNVITLVSGFINNDLWGNGINLAYNNGDSYFRIYADEHTKNIVWAALYEGSYDASTLPAYQPKGYAAEFAECQRYFERLGVASSDILGAVAFAKSGAKSVLISIKYQPKRIGSPTISLGDVSKYRLLLRDAINASVFSGTPISSFDDIIVQSPFASFRVTIPNPLDRDCWVILQRADNSDGAYIDVNADL